MTSLTCFRPCSSASTSSLVLYSAKLARQQEELKRPEQRDDNPPKPVELTEEERKIVEPLRNEELSFEELVQLTGFSAQKINSYLTMLELRGIIVKVPGGMYRAYL